MNIYVRLTDEELQETGFSDDELEVDIIERLESASPELPGYNISDGNPRHLRTLQEGSGDLSPNGHSALGREGRAASV